jgi:hypothetical protein
MLSPSFNKLDANLILAIQDGALAAASLSSPSGVEIEFILASLHSRRSNELTKFFDNGPKFEAMCQKFLVLPENRTLPRATSADDYIPVPNADYASGWSITFAPELLRILAGASRLAVEDGRSHASIKDLMDSLAQETQATSRLKSKWNISLKLP